MQAEHETVQVPAQLELEHKRSPWWHTFTPGGSANVMVLWVGVAVIAYIGITMAHESAQMNRTNSKSLEILSSDLNKRTQQLAAQQEGQSQQLAQVQGAVESTRREVRQEEDQLQAQQAALQHTLTVYGARLQRLEHPAQPPMITGTVRPVPQPSQQPAREPEPTAQVLPSGNLTLKPCIGATLGKDGTYWDVPSVANQQVQYIQVIPLEQTSSGVSVINMANGKRYVVTPKCGWMGGE